MQRLRRAFGDEIRVPRNKDRNDGYARPDRLLDFADKSAGFMMRDGPQRLPRCDRDYLVIAAVRNKDHAVAFSLNRSAVTGKSGHMPAAPRERCEEPNRYTMRLLPQLRWRPQRMS